MAVQLQIYIEKKKKDLEMSQTSYHGTALVLSYENGTRLFTCELCIRIFYNGSNIKKMRFINYLFVKNIIKNERKSFL